jgi:hypothetical protein
MEEHQLQAHQVADILRAIGRAYGAVILVGAISPGVLAALQRHFNPAKWDPPAGKSTALRNGQGEFGDPDRVIAHPAGRGPYCLYALLWPESYLGCLSRQSN